MISIIVPVYKAETFITRCIESIISQTYPNWELILVDDGSPDNSGRICEEFAQKDSRIHVFHKPNGGVSSARNLGIESAKGDWITFIDSDDYIRPNYLENLSNSADDDLIISGSQRFGESEDDYRLPESRKYEIHEFIKMVFEAKSEDDIYTSCISYPWGKLLKSDIIKHNDLYFNSKMKLAEDTNFMLQYLENVRNVSFLKGGDYMYNVTLRPKSYLQMSVEEYMMHVDGITKTVHCLGDLFHIDTKNYLNSMYSLFFNAFLRRQSKLGYKMVINQYVTLKSFNCFKIEDLTQRMSPRKRVAIKVAMINGFLFYTITRCFRF